MNKFDPKFVHVIALPPDYTPVCKILKSEAFHSLYPVAYSIIKKNFCIAIYVWILAPHDYWFKVLKSFIHIRSYKFRPPDLSLLFAVIICVYTRYWIVYCLAWYQLYKPTISSIRKNVCISTFGKNHGIPKVTLFSHWSPCHIH